MTKSLKRDNVWWKANMATVLAVKIRLAAPVLSQTQFILVR